MTAAIHLVGAGPGDPGLVTLKAEAVLAVAAVVMTDAAVEHLAAALAPTAEVAVADGLDAAAVAEQLARGPHPAVRLYRGDPWLHDRHGAERSALLAGGAAVEAVPGISVAVGEATAAGVATHHRGVGVAAWIHGERVEPVVARTGASASNLEATTTTERRGAAVRA